jgi:hypothetical protein
MWMFRMSSYSVSFLQVDRWRDGKGGRDRDWMGHFSYWSASLRLIYGAKPWTAKSNVEAILDAINKTGVQVHAENNNTYVPCLITKMQEKLKANKSFKIAVHLNCLGTTSSCCRVSGIKATWDN